MSRFDQRYQQVDSQVNIGTLNVTMLSDLDRVDPAAKQQLRALYESRIRYAPHQASYHLALALYYLDCGLYAFAANALLTAHQLAPMDANILYYLALASLQGRAPRSLTLAEVRSVESYLNASWQRGGDQAHYLYLWALVKYDYYAANGLRVPPPNIEQLLAQAARATFDGAELKHLLSHVPTAGNPIADIIGSQL